jgi:toxin YoeB
VTKIVWHVAAWHEYVDGTEPKMIKRINLLIEDILGNGNDGIGKPEALRSDLSGWWSRRINQERRLVYRVVGDEVQIARCRYHY